MKKIIVRGCRQLLTLHGPTGPRRGAALRDLGLIQDGAVLIVDGIVSAVGPSRRIENLAESRGAEEIDASGRVVMPAFVDSHTHLVHGPPRLLDYEMAIAGSDYREIAKAGGGILNSVKAVRTIPGPRLEFTARRFLREMIRHGSGTIEVKSGYGLDLTGEMKTLRIYAALANEEPVDLAVTYLGAHLVPPEFEGRPDDYIGWIDAEMLPRIARRKLARFADVYCEPSAFGLAETRRYLESARRHGFLLKVHAEQFERSGGARLGVEMGAVSVDHLEQANEEDAAALARSNTIATLLPGSVFHLGLTRYAPARMLIESGAAVALATDFNPGTSPTLSMPMIISLACNQMRMTPAEAVSAATINGAHALRMADRVGSLEYGKQADLLFLNASDYREIPYYFGLNLVAATMKKGRIIHSDTEALCTAD